MIKFNIKFISKLNFLKFLFYVFPFIIFTSSGYLNFYISIFIIFSLYFFFSNKIKLDFFLLDYLVVIFFLILIFSSLININEIGVFLFLKSLLNLRFAVLFIIIRNIINLKIINTYYLFILSLTSVSLLSFDIFLQHLTGFDFFGNQPFDGRYNGFFEHEAIAGSYLQKFFLLSLLSIFLSKTYDKIKFLLSILFINICGLGILLSLDRMPYLIFVFNILILCIILKDFRSRLLVSLTIIILLFKISYNDYSVVKERYERIMGQLDIKGFIKFFSNNNKDPSSTTVKVNDNKINDIFTSDYIKIYISAYNVFLENPLIGSGLKSFSLVCSRISTDNSANLRCSTHPHNIYLEILVSQGIIGISIFFIFLFILLKKKYQEFNVEKINNNNRIISIFFFTVLIGELVPFRSYGSIFTTVNGSLFWFLLAITSSTILIKKIKFN